MKVEYVDHMGSDLTVVNAARVSFNKHKEQFEESDEKLIKFLATHNHWTPFGHPQICLRMKAPVPIRTQCFKHKVGFVENEVSRRYVDEDPEFFYPKKWRKRPDNGVKQGSSDDEITNIIFKDIGGEWSCSVQSIYSEVMEECYRYYIALIENGLAPELARFILPQAMYTEWYWTGSLASYARFANLRLDSHAQAEVRELAEMVSDVVEPLFPVSWKYLVHEVQK